MSWQAQLRGDSVSWLLEKDDPGVRYLALRDLCGLPEDDVELLGARALACAQGPIGTILEAMNKEGYWERPGPGYAPKYRGTVWSIISLAQLGARVEMDERIRRGCAYLLDHALTQQGQFSISGAPSGTVDCLQGNLCAALLDLGVDDPRMEGAFDWMARTVTGEGIAPMGDKKAERRYYAGKRGPDFVCGANNKLACAWGAVKVLSALARMPAHTRSQAHEDAIERGVAFLLSVDPAEAAYPTGYADKPSGNWWKFGFPVFYISDLMQVAEALIRVGRGNDPRLKNVLDLIRGKQDQEGRWMLEYGYAGKTWVDFGTLRRPSKWVTLRAVSVLRQAHMATQAR